MLKTPEIAQTPLKPEETSYLLSWNPSLRIEEIISVSRKVKILLVESRNGKAYCAPYALKPEIQYSSKMLE